MWNTNDDSYADIDHFNSPHIASMTVWNTNDDIYSDFDHFYEKEKKSLKVRKHLFIARALSVGQCGILTMIDTPIFCHFLKINVCI